MFVLCLAFMSIAIPLIILFYISQQQYLSSHSNEGNWIDTEIQFSLTGWNHSLFHFKLDFSLSYLILAWMNERTWAGGGISASIPPERRRQERKNELSRQGIKELINKLNSGCKSLIQTQRKSWKRCRVFNAANYFTLSSASLRFALNWIKLKERISWLERIELRHQFNSLNIKNEWIKPTHVK